MGDNMDHALSAVLYDLPAERRKDYLNWFHEIHIPKLLSECGYLWAAHYEIVPLGARFKSSPKAWDGQTIRTSHRV